MKLHDVIRARALHRPSPDTARYHVRIGLLDPRHHHNANGYESFPIDDAKRLRPIHQAKESGYSLADLLSDRDYAALPKTGINAESPQEVCP